MEKPLTNEIKCERFRKNGRGRPALDSTCIRCGVSYKNHGKPNGFGNSQNALRKDAIALPSIEPRETRRKPRQDLSNKLLEIGVNW